MTSSTPRPVRSLARTCASCQAAGLVVLGLCALGFAAVTFAAERAAGHRGFLDGVIPTLGLVVGAVTLTLAAVLGTAAALVRRGGQGSRITLMVVELAILLVSLRFAALAWSNDLGAALWWVNVALAVAALVGLVRPELHRPADVVRSGNPARDGTPGHRSIGT